MDTTEYDERVQLIIADPLAGHSADEARRLVQGERSEAALRHPAPALLLERVADKLDLSEAEVASLFEDTKRFLVVGTVLGRNFAPSVPVDALWHEWILFTDDYHTFCLTLGDSYIHHTPIPQGSASQPPLEPTMEALEAVFGPLDDRWWPVALGASGIMDCCMGPW